MNNNEIYFFLNYGYFPNYKPLYKPEKVDKLALKNKSYDELQNSFYKIFKEVIKEAINKIPDNKLIIIPISGGLDSRAILAGVLEFVPVDRIKTYTFGIKGSYDYEIGIETAQKAGVFHQAIDLNEVRYTQEELLEVAKKCDWQTHLFHHPPLRFLEEFIEDNIIFSGYLGDLIFGSYANKAKIDKHDIKKWYLKNKKYSKFINQPYFDEFMDLIPNIDKNSIVSPVEQLILYERGPKLTAPHILMKGWNYELPFIDKRIMDFMFSLPNRYRINEFFFIDTMIRYYPDLFQIRSKTTYGHHLKSLKPVLYAERLKNKLIRKLNNIGFNFIYKPYNYLDFDKGIIDRSDFKEIFRQNLIDLEKRNILNDFSPTEILKKHYKSKDLSQILILLTSLEIILKSKEQ